MPIAAEAIDRANRDFASTRGSACYARSMAPAYQCGTTARCLPLSVMGFLPSKRSINDHAVMANVRGAIDINNHHQVEVAGSVEHVVPAIEPLILNGG